MKEITLHISKDKLPYFEKVCKDNYMVITKVESENELICRVYLEYNPIMAGLILVDIFYAGMNYQIKQLTFLTLGF